ncbi:MAG: hypothetical protein M0Z46_20010 [Actinomycetota bacterium]|nr:hypothetical protein [Actinomycetota bacterium]
MRANDLAGDMYQASSVAASRAVRAAVGGTAPGHVSGTLSPASFEVLDLALADAVYADLEEDNHA